MIKRALKALPGILVFLLGLSAVVGWLAKIPVFLHPTQLYMPITFGGSICFCFAGIALICFPFPGRIFRIIQLSAGSFLFLISVLTLIQYIFHMDLGIDHLVDTSWVKSSTVYPGRIAANSAIGFMLTGLIFILFNFAYKKMIAGIIEGCIFSLFTIGMLSVLGYFLNIEFLYSWIAYTSMSVYSGVVFALLGLGLWYFWRQSDYCYELYRGKEDKKLTLLSGILLLTISLIVGLSSFSSLAKEEAGVMKNMMHILPVILFAVIIGLLFLRLEIIPLIKRMVNAEKELVKSNALLTKSKERYALAVRGSNAGLWDWEIQTGYVFYSPYLKNMLGYTDKELPNNIEAFQERLHPEDSVRVNDAINEHILHHVPYAIEYRLKRKSGEYHWFQAVGQATWDEQGNGVRMAGSLVDVTERKINERRLSMQYSVTQILSEADNLQDAVSEIIKMICSELQWDYGAIWLVNQKKNKLDYLSSWHVDSREAEKFLEARKKIVFNSGKGVMGRVWRNKKPYWCPVLAKDSNFLQQDEARHANFNAGFSFPMILQSNVFGVMEFYSYEIDPPDEKLLQMMATIGPQISQFSQRKNIEYELRQSEAHKSAILNSALDGIITITDKGLIVSFNLQTQKMFGFTENEIINKNMDDLIPGLTSQASNIVNKPPVEFLGFNKEGNSFPAELTLSGMKMNRKNIFVIIVRDITERKKIEKLKNEFVSVVSHELRTPLTSIRGSLGLVLGGVVGSFSDKARNLLDIANNNCERLLHLINDILDVEKIESGKMSFHILPVEISKIVKESIAANQMYGEKFGVKVSLVESVSHVLVNVDFDRMLQVMANLISNAVKFSKQGDSVDISIKVLNKVVRVSVTDYGSGIPENFKSAIFQKFSQADTTTTRGKGGTGLGLNITKSIIEKFSGTINFVSEANKKTIFYFDLPVWIEEKETNPVIDKIILESKKSLLICEDDEDQAQYVKAMLETTGFNVDIALTASDARNLLKENQYQGILLDLILPDQDGISFIRELRGNHQTKNLPIIVMSVIAKTGHTLLNGDAFSVLDWLDKPIDFSKLLKTVAVIKQKNKHIPKIIHVEDDEEARKMVKTLLQDLADVVCATTLQEAKIKLINEKFELVILDLLLPDGRGSELLPLLAKSETPVIVFSSVELDREHSEFVKNVLIKSETSHEKLLKTIEKIIHVAY